MSPPSGKPTLARAVSRWQVVSLGANDVIGGGVYLLPAVAAAALGSASPWAVLAAGALVLMLVLCFAEAGSLFDEPGSGYVYTREAFGEFVGFEVGWMTWIARVASAASLANGVALAITGVWPGAAGGAGRALVVIAVLGGLTAINLAGVKHGARTAVVLIVCKLLPLLLLIAVGIFAIHWGRVFAVPRPDMKGLGSVGLLLLFAYAGFENTAGAAGEFRNPRRDVPFALILTISSVTAIYTLIQLIALGVVPGLGSTKTPLADAAGILVGRSGIWLLTVGGVLSVIGTCNNAVLAGGRYLYALAARGRVPRVFASVHPRFRTPWIALLTHLALAVPLALSGSFAQIAALSVIARMASYIGTAAAVPVLRRKLPATARTVRLPGGPVIPIAALVVCLIFLSSATRRNLVAGAIALAVGAIIYVAHRGRSPAGLTPAPDGTDDASESRYSVLP
ncbi:MAG TPA: APC family permease [Kofleriaceae bacterium]|nr:APC family permease [Kofleriaceae bacterium]